MWPQSSKRTPPWLHCMPNCEGNTTLNNPPGRGCDLAQMQFEHLQQLKTNTHMGYDKKAAALRNRSFSELEWTHINVDGVICSWQPSCMSTGAQQAAAVLPQEWADNVGAQRAAAVLPQELTDNVGATSPAYRCRNCLAKFNTEGRYFQTRSMLQSSAWCLSSAHELYRPKIAHA
eukprot:822249-Pelagomonas_calceolata.AAC.3